MLEHPTAATMVFFGMLSATLAAAPVILFEPEQTVFIVGEAVTLRCVADNPSTISQYSFYKDGAVISVSQDRAKNILIHSSLSTKDAGRYFCTYIREASEGGNKTYESKTIQLIVNERPSAPTISADPELSIYYTGQSVTLHCLLQSSIGVEGKFLYKDGLEVTESVVNGVLMLKDIRESNAGKYSCVYTIRVNGRVVHSPQSESKTLLVTPAPVIRFEPEQTVFIVGEAVTLRCVADNPSTISQYSFYKDGAVISVSQDRAKNILIHSSLSTKDAGRYFCTYVREASEGGNKTYESKTIQLIVNERPSAPTISADPELSIYYTGQSVTLHCLLQSSIGVEGKFLYKDGLEVTESAVNGVLMLKDIRESNAGKYSCVYTINKSGREVQSQSSEPKTLLVTRPPPTPNLRFHPKNPQVQDEQVQLICEASFPSSINRYRFYKNGKDLTDRSGHKENVFTISNYTMAFEGCYFCQTIRMEFEQEITSPESSMQFLSSKETGGRECQNLDGESDKFLSHQGILLYGSVLIGKILVLISVLLIFGIHIMLMRKISIPEAETQ
ncbi:Fc receptor-like protein 5 isoform X3 [Ascaphus truei]|uniref:Fc receptor-like protein 5 isoform X3 n=1 Tax=Ascaphus truei TaxID=8439 RepID=UPI003F5915C1